MRERTRGGSTTSASCDFAPHAGGNVLAPFGALREHGDEGDESDASIVLVNDESHYLV
jgi:hypothetical protein